MADPLALHAALLGATEQPKAGDQYTVEFLRAKVDALLAVVELHRPVSIGLTRLSDGADIPMCKACSFGSFSGGQPLVRVGWSDCLTVRAVAGELGVDLNE